MSYFFEDDSAEIIGEILKSSRNGEVSLQRIAEETSTNIDILEDFFNQLCQLNLLTVEPVTSEGVLTYRKNLAAWKKDNNVQRDASTKEKLPMEQTNAEMAYTARVGGITSVMFELTYNCSEKCIHCYNIGATRNDEEISHRDVPDKLSFNDYTRIIDDLYDFGLVKVTLSGGDPFSNPLAWEIIDYLYKKGIVFDIYTNGLALRKEEDVNRLANYYPRLVGISIYSSDSKVHDYITRINGSWERSMRTAKWLSDKSVPMNIKCCVMQPNLKTYRGVRKIAFDLGAFPQFEINVTDSIEGDKCVSKFLRLTPEQYEIVLRDDNIPLYVGPEAPNYGGQPKTMTTNACGAGQNTFCISPSGEFMPCCALHLVFGNLKESSTKEILGNECHRQWIESTLNDYEECGKHEYCDYCNLCPGLGFSEHGNYYKASENCCNLAKIRHGLAHKMMKGYDPIENLTIDACIEQLPDYQQKSIKIIKNMATYKEFGDILTVLSTTTEEDERLKLINALRKNIIERNGGSIIHLPISKIIVDALEANEEQLQEINFALKQMER